MLAREGWRRLARRLRSGPLFRWRFSGRTPERVLIAPPDLRIGDPEIAASIYYGRFYLAGRLVETGGESPFGLHGLPPEWQRSLHSFRWLRHMRAADSGLASANARTLVGDWLRTDGSRLSGVAWDPSVTARRIIAWLQHSTVVLKGAEFPFYRAFLKSLALQIRYLRAVCAEMPDGEERLRARIALAYAALSLPVASSTLRNATRQLVRELDRQILADGGHVSRNPQAVLELLADLLPLRQTYANQAETPPAALMNAIDRMLPALRFFRHQDGSLARFNGMGATIPERVVAILRHDDTAGLPLTNAPHSGYQHLTAGGTTIIADTGAPPVMELSTQAHAGCLSFEMSSGRRMFIVNSGIDTSGPEEFRMLARATAAHSTATVNDTSSCRFTVSRGTRRMLGNPIMEGPRRVSVRRTDDEGSGRIGFVASHDGYAQRLGVIHERRLSLSSDGATIEGADRFLRPNGERLREDAGIAVAVRFHLHPTCAVLRDEAGRLVLPGSDQEAWIFTCDDVAPLVEESIYFAGTGGAKKSMQIVLPFVPGHSDAIAWRLTRTHLGLA